MPLTQPTCTASQRSIAILSDDELQNLPAQRWIVKGIVPETGVGAIYGASGTYKSFLALDMLAHVGNGVAWFGNRVRLAHALYLPFEGQGGIPKRVAAWRQIKSQQSGHLVSARVGFVMDRLNLRDQTDRDRLVASLRERGWAGGLICIDTLAQAGQGIEENSSAMGEMIGIFEELKLRLNCAVLIIHHAGKDLGRGMRGWSGLHAAMDFVIEVEPRGKGAVNSKFVLTKVKDGQDGRAFEFSTTPVDLGVDEDGDRITSLTVSPPVQIDIGGLMGDEQEDSARQEARDAEDDEFVWRWIKEQVEAGGYPTGRSLEGQREQMRRLRTLTQKQLRDSINRLKAASRVVESEEKAPSGNKWLEAK